MCIRLLACIKNEIGLKNTPFFFCSSFKSPRKKSFLDSVFSVVPTGAGGFEFPFAISFAYFSLYVGLSGSEGSLIAFLNEVGLNN